MGYSELQSAVAYKSCKETKRVGKKLSKAQPMSSYVIRMKMIKTSMTMTSKTIME